MSYTYLSLAKDILADSKTPLRLGQIWDKAKQKSLDKKLENATTPSKQALSRALHDDSRRNNAGIFAFSKNPTLFGLEGTHSKDYTPSEEESQNPKTSFKERDLHPLFVKCANENLNVFCKTIYHEQSKKSQKGQNKWLHPDIVGVSFAFNDYTQKETLEIAKKLSYPQVKLYSFELKISLDFSNLKQCYFQAISNSSWANEAYLVVFHKIDDEELFNVLKKLNARFGVGIINFGINPDEFEILIPAKEKDKIDISMIDELVEKSNDFKSFIEKLSNDMERDKRYFSPQEYDEILDNDRVQSYIREHKITREC